jgi:hypothetical protein
MLPQLLPILSPRIEMRLDINRAPNALLLADRPELLERRRAVDAGLVGARRLQDVVGAAVGGDAAFLLRGGGGVVRAVGLNDVVLDERVARPAVQRDVRVDVGGVPGTAVGHVADAAGVPAFAGDEVAYVGPLDVVLVGC